ASSGAFNWKPSVAGNYSFGVKVTDNGSPTLSDQETITVTVLNTSGSIVRINSGGAAAATSLGSFSADAYFSGATSVSTTTSPIAGTSADILYQNNLRATDVGGSFTYNIPVSNGTYTVKLHFAETFHTTAGQRKFNVKAEATAWLTNYDIVTAAGGAKAAVVASKNITVADGTLTLLFTSVVDKACVSAIEVLPANGVEPSETTTNLIANLYPNPADNFLNIDLIADVERVSAKITNSTGDVVKTIDQFAENNKLQIEVSELEAGLYQLHVQTPTGVQVYRFVKK
ncbi:MAG: malectin domain-containing carbohydrate-binding protein, partial [Bacteroidota bacterium]|nr:malectin domain-containing carbohydrate-binding protein [Bacteroidota bacterium]